MVCVLRNIECFRAWAMVQKSRKLSDFIKIKGMAKAAEEMVE